MYINIELITVDNHKNGSFYEEIRGCVCMSHMTQSEATTISLNSLSTLL